MGFPAGWPRGRAGRAGVACPGGVAAGAVTATLICACRVRRSVAGRMVPLTSTGNHQGARRGDGDRFCRGERPARHRLVGSPGPGSGGGHLGPHEPGQLAGDRGGGLRRGLGGVQQVQVPGVQAPLRLPRPGQGLPRRRRPGGGPAARRSPGRAGVSGPASVSAVRTGSEPALVMCPRRIRSPATARSARRCPGSSPAGPPPAPAARGPPTGPAWPR
jgi:hypothetical protein